MKSKIRKTDSLAHATGSFLNSLELFQKRWEETVEKLLKHGKYINDNVKSIKSSSQKVNLDNGILKSFTELGEIFNELEKIYADQYILMTEIDGLEIPVDAARKLLEQGKKQENKLVMIKNSAQNLSKTLTFFAKNNADVELISTAGQSFNDDFNEYTSMIEETRNLLLELNKQLAEGHDKAIKYSDTF